MNFDSRDHNHGVIRVDGVFQGFSPTISFTFVPKLKDRKTMCYRYESYGTIKSEIKLSSNLYGNTTIYNSDSTDGVYLELDHVNLWRYERSLCRAFELLELRDNE